MRATLNFNNASGQKTKKTATLNVSSVRDQCAYQISDKSAQTFLWWKIKLNPNFLVYSYAFWNNYHCLEPFRLDFIHSHCTIKLKADIKQLCDSDIHWLHTKQWHHYSCKPFLLFLRWLNVYMRVKLWIIPMWRHSAGATPLKLKCDKDNRIGCTLV